MSVRTPLARARGLGSAHEGAGHWWMQRTTAAALVPLGTWFVVEFVRVMGLGRDAFVARVADPVNAVLLLLFLAAALYHGWLGAKVVVEDYVASPGRRLAVLAVLAAAGWIAAAVSLLAVLRIGLGS